MKKILLGLCAILLLAGCQKTTDPSQGGLFSYSPEAYKQRKLEREERLKELQREQIAEEQRQAALTQTAAEKRNERGAMQKKLQDANRESVNLEKKLQAFKAQNDAQKAALEDLKGRQARLHADIRASQSGKAGGTEAARQVEAERLRREVERLVKDTEALSGL
ncbi:MAG: lipoprotein [Deltaproteobacteria bacterium]|jgi:exonuclease VII large subunit|nr:lipoprotein [Deltaproteobacteria bacterium]